MLRLLFSIIVMLPLLVSTFSRYQMSLSVGILFSALFLAGGFLFIYTLAVFLVDRGIRMPHSSSQDELVRIRSSLEDKWRK